MRAPPRAGPVIIGEFMNSRPSPSGARTEPVIETTWRFVRFGIGALPRTAEGILIGAAPFEAAPLLKRADKSKGGGGDRGDRGDRKSAMPKCAN